MHVAAVLIAVGVALALFLWLLTDEPAVAGFGAAIAWIGVMVLISTFLPAWVRAKMRKVPRPLGWLLRLFTALSLIPLPPPWRGYELIAAQPPPGRMFFLAVLILRQRQLIGAQMWPASSAATNWGSI